MPAHLLVADDSNVIRKVARRICEDLSLKVSEAEDGQSALELCRADMPDAILVDAHMPGMDSLDFVRALRELDGGKEPKVVYCLTEYSVSNVARAKRAGADDHLLKPFDRDVIEAKLQEIGVL
jgi:two-component system chemotaxis response regulator CheY